MKEESWSFAGRLLDQALIAIKHAIRAMPHLGMGAGSTVKHCACRDTEPSRVPLMTANRRLEWVERRHEKVTQVL
jgi:hypothetical protein